MSTSKQKGDGRERDLVRRLNGIDGVEATRVMLSAQAGKHADHDVAVSLHKIDEDLAAEVKYRADARGFSQVLEWLGDNHFLALYSAGRQPVAVVPWNFFEQLLEAYANGGTPGGSEGSGPDCEDYVDEDIVDHRDFEAE